MLGETEENGFSVVTVIIKNNKSVTARNENCGYLRVFAFAHGFYHDLMPQQLVGLRVTHSCIAGWLGTYVFPQRAALVHSGIHVLIDKQETRRSNSVLAGTFFFLVCYKTNTEE